MAAPVTLRDHNKHLFRLAYGVLALAFWGSVAGFVVLLTRPNHSRAVAWSAWKPSDPGLLGAREIGRRVAAQYRLPTGAELSAVQEHTAEVQGLRLEAIGVQRVASAGRLNQYVDLYPTDNTLIYAFCGADSNCAISGSDTLSRQRALRREALELSLYAFKYLGVDQVVSLVQSTKTGGTSAVFLRKRDFGAELRHPLRATLPLATPPDSGAVDSKEANVIDELTIPYTFPAHFEPLPDGDAILVLTLNSQS